MASRGGRRPGAGRKPKPKWPAAVVTHPSSPVVPVQPAPVEEFDAPASLTHDERQVWAVQAPHAFAARTLTRATVLSFVRYCRVVVLEDTLGKGKWAGGADHRGVMRQINAYELQFMLTPCGKPIPVPVVAVVDADADFFATGS